ncbi:MAG: YdcF family protein [Acidobacteria bacterium]|nr:YdcF family protein [Acidobacteriota bacterium]
MSGGFVARHRFAAGFIFALLVLAVGRWVINRTAIVDHLVAPLLVADTNGNADALVILGAGVSGSCTPNLAGIRRVLLGAAALRQNRAPIAIVTGGASDRECTIAEAMRRLALDIGVPEAKLIVESRARSTRENATRTAPLLRALGARRVLLVTDKLHMGRAAQTFEALGFNVERSSVPVNEHAPNNVALGLGGLREVAALTYYRMRGWLQPSGGIDPPQLSEAQVRQARDIPAHPNGPLVILGASYAQGWQPGTIADAAVVNLGITGQQSFEFLDRFERDVVPLQPRAVIIWGFINDVFRAEPGQQAQSTTRARESYERMVTLARQHGIEPIVATEVTMRAEDTWRERLSALLNVFRGREGYQDTINRHVRETNAWLRTFAARERLLLLDFEAVLAEPGGGQRRREFVQADGSHVSDAGYQALSEYARPILERHVSSR